MNVVLVESPTKVKSIGKYLGKDYYVLATYGHVRDLPSKTGSINTEENFEPKWQVLEKAVKPLKAIEKAVKNANSLILATDPDREGEAISWHVLEHLKEQKLLSHLHVERVAFNAITKSAVLDALKKPRTLNQELIDAYLARLSLDYLVGFTLSPVLWRKLPGSRSAGRVQSVSLRLVVEREQEIEAFKTREYWTVEGLFQENAKAHSFKSRLIVYETEKLDKFSISDEKLAQEIVQKTLLQKYHVASLEKKRVKRNPPPPFTTSTLQQEASRKLGMSPSRTMMLAQQLYEGIEIKGETTGLITYMRTDSVHVTPEGIHGCRDYIQKNFGKNYVPESPRAYKTKAKNAQEAHEAIRPTDLNHHPDRVRGSLEKQAFELYELIWKRMLASQMAQAEFDQTGVDISSEDKKIIFRATGSVLIFDGFLKLYQESLDEGEKDEWEGSHLPILSENQKLLCEKISPYQHFTQPPPRYSEASLVKKMEEIGIGRPSTYARIMQVLKDRNYVRMEKRQLIPEERGRLVTTFLKHFFAQYVEYDFTANLEHQLDDISSGELSWKDVLNEFWTKFYATIKESEKLKIQDVLETLEGDLAHHLFPSNERGCPDCKEGQLGLRLGKYGAFLGCSRYPECGFTRPLDGTTHEEDEESSEGKSGAHFPKALGVDPETGEDVTMRLGPYGLYLQWGEGKKPKRVSLPKGYDVDEVSLETACVFGMLPRKLGTHPETNLEIMAGLGRFGAYFKHGDKYVSTKDLDMVLKGSLSDAVIFINQKAAQPPRQFKRGSTTKKTSKTEGSATKNPKTVLRKKAAPKKVVSKATPKKRIPKENLKK